MKRVTVFGFVVIISVSIILSLTACSSGGEGFNEPNVTKLKSEYLKMTLNASMVLGFSDDASTIVALRTEGLNQEVKKLVFFDSKTASEKGQVIMGEGMISDQKRARWSEDGKTFVLSDAWNASIEARSNEQTPGIAINMEDFTSSSYGQAEIENEGNVVISPAFDPTGAYITYSVYNKKTDETIHYMNNGSEDEDSMLLSSKTKGRASLLTLSKDKYLESVEITDESIDTILFRDGEIKTDILRVKDPFRSVYIKDYCKNRRRILLFETSLVTQGTQIATEKIIPKIVEFDEEFENFVVKEVQISDRYDVLNGVLSSDGRYALFIVYRNQNFIMTLYDINSSKTYELLKNQDIGSTFMGTMPGRVDGLFMSKDRKICLVADNGIFLFELE